MELTLLDLKVKKQVSVPPNRLISLNKDTILIYLVSGCKRPGISTAVMNVKINNISKEDDVIGNILRPIVTLARDSATPEK